MLGISTSPANSSTGQSATTRRRMMRLRRRNAVADQSDGRPDVLTYVAPEEVAEPTNLMVGLIGRAKRDCDGQELEVVHVEDRRR